MRLNKAYFWLAIMMLPMLCGCKKEKGYITVEGAVWHTGFHVTYESDRDLSDSIIAEFGNVERSVSVFMPSSVVCAVNEVDRECQVDSIFAQVYGMSRKVWSESAGYFDPTLSPLIKAYGFGGKEVDAAPDTHIVDSIMKFVGMDKTGLVNGILVKQHPSVQFNFSAIAKGYGCDAVGDMLRRQGCRNYMVEIGGEIAVEGKAPSGGKWQIQIDKPVFSADSTVHEAQEIISVTNCGIATSGNYRNYRADSSGKRIGHTLDPHTGKPALNDMLSATVVSPTCMEADAYATACMAMGSSKAKEMSRRLGLKVMLVTSEGEIWMTEGFRKLIIKK